MLLGEGATEPEAAEMKQNVTQGHSLWCQKPESYDADLCINNAVPNCPEVTPLVVENRLIEPPRETSTEPEATPSLQRLAPLKACHNISV